MHVRFLYGRELGAPLLARGRVGEGGDDGAEQREYGQADGRHYDHVARVVRVAWAHMQHLHLVEAALHAARTHWACEQCRCAHVCKGTAWMSSLTSGQSNAGMKHRKWGCSTIQGANE